MNVKPRERAAILQSLGAGVVPRIGLHLIQVGRKRELEAMISDLETVEDKGASIRLVIGPFGSGKSFFLNLIRTIALERKFVVLQGDITLERRLHGTQGQARALYTELINNMSTRAKPEGGAMPGLIERFVVDAHQKVGSQGDAQAFDNYVGDCLRPLLDLTHGANFIRVLARYIEGFDTQNKDLMDSAMRWLRGEYSTKTEARDDLGVRDIIQDYDLYDMLKLWVGFVRLVGYIGVFVNIDELVVLSERLSGSSARIKNYEILLQILNDCLQGHVQGLGFCLAGTEEFLTDTKRGLYSYKALSTRLADNPFAVSGLVDTRGPVIRLQPLTKEEMYVLLERIVNVYALGDQAKRLIDYKGITQFMEYCNKALGAEHHLTPRNTIKQFIGLLNVLEQNPGKQVLELLALAKNYAADESIDLAHPEGTLPIETTGKQPKGPRRMIP